MIRNGLSGYTAVQMLVYVPFRLQKEINCRFVFFRFHKRHPCSRIINHMFLIVNLPYIQFCLFNVRFIQTVVFHFLFIQFSENLFIPTRTGGNKRKTGLCALLSTKQHTRLFHARMVAGIVCLQHSLILRVVSLLTRVRAAESGMLHRLRNAPSLPTWHLPSCSGSLSAHIHRMLRGFLTLTAPGTRGFSPHSVYAQP